MLNTTTDTTAVDARIRVAKRALRAREDAFWITDAAYRADPTDAQRAHWHEVQDHYSDAVCAVSDLCGQRRILIGKPSWRERE